LRFGVRQPSDKARSRNAGGTARGSIERNTAVSSNYDTRTGGNDAGKAALYRMSLVVRRVLTIIGVALALAAFMTGTVYGLYRIALFSKQVYAIVFFCAAGLLAAFFVYQALCHGLLKRILLKTARVLAYILLVSGVACAFALIGGLAMRIPLAGLAAGLAALFAAAYFLPRLRVGAFFEKYLS
jgi:hypothetical protein